MSKPKTPPSNEALLERAVELSYLRERIMERKSLLLFGEEGVGKTRLLQQIATNNKNVLYIAKGHAPREFLCSLLEALDKNRDSKVARTRSLQATSVVSLKGIAQKELAVNTRILIVDHVQSPAPTMSFLIKELNYYGRTPIIFAARSPHMEDIGLLQSLCLDKSERLELKNWPEAAAMDFARHQAVVTNLMVSNLEFALEGIVEMSRGNPGAILKMIDMARQPQYRLGDRLKVHILYLDFRMRGVSALKLQRLSNGS